MFYKRRHTYICWVCICFPLSLSNVIIYVSSTQRVWTLPVTSQRPPVMHLKLKATKILINNHQCQLFLEQDPGLFLFFKGSKDHKSMCSVWVLRCFCKLKIGGIQPVSGRCICDSNLPSCWICKHVEHSKVYGWAKKADWEAFLMPDPSLSLHFSWPEKCV